MKVSMAVMQIQGEPDEAEGSGSLTAPLFKDGIALVCTTLVSDDSLSLRPAR